MRKFTVVIILVLTFFTGFLTEIQARPQQTELIPFKLKDQFDREFEERDFHHWILVLTGFDRSGSEYAESWMQAIHDALEGNEEFYKVLQVAVADLRGIPFFLKGFVRGKFPEKRSRWVLMDWDGVFSKAYSLQSKVTNILVFDCSSKLIHQTYGREIDQKKLDVIVAKILDVMPDCE